MRLLPGDGAQIDGEIAGDHVGVLLGIFAPDDQGSGYDRANVLARADDLGAGTLLERVDVGRPHAGERTRAGREGRDDRLLIEVHDLHVLGAEAPFLQAIERGVFAGRVGGEQKLLALEGGRVLLEFRSFGAAGQHRIRRRFVIGDADRHDVEARGAENRGGRTGTPDVPGLRCRGGHLRRAGGEQREARVESDLLPPALLGGDVVGQRPIERGLVADLDRRGLLLLRVAVAAAPAPRPQARASRIKICLLMFLLPVFFSFVRHPVASAAARASRPGRVGGRRKAFPSPPRSRGLPTPLPDGSPGPR